MKLFVRSTMGPSVGVHCTLPDVFPCRSSFAEIFSLCVSDLHESTISSIHSLHGLPLLLIPSVMPNTNAFSFLLSSILQMWPNSFLCTIHCDRSISILSLSQISKEKLGKCHQTRPQTDGLDLGRSRGTGERQSRMASTCGPMQPSGCEMN